MKTRAALLRQSPRKWVVEEVELDEPKYGEVLVEMAAAGLCHGGIGFTWEHPAHLYFRRAKSSEIYLGDGNYHRDVLAWRLDA